MAFPVERMRRLRVSAGVRDLIAETEVRARNLILPIFISDVDSKPQEIKSMPGQYRWPVADLPELINKIRTRDIGGVILFGIPREKDAVGSGAWSENGGVQQGIRMIKDALPDLPVITDVCLCEYTDHGHCGLLDGEKILNDSSLAALAQTALSHARAGADIVAPSDMMDGRVAAIREALDQESFTETLILSYAVKYASAYYGPFRDAADSAPRFGDRRSYQMDFRNRREAVREALGDVSEGADIVMVKPGVAYLDILRDVREAVKTPLATYQVSGEYAMIKAAAAQGWIDETKIVLETLTAFKRAGADFIITYYALEAADYLAF
jgi:porphobilinogen synthase